jgi:DNA-binding HxlR family transcriptional regulator
MREKLGGCRCTASFAIGILQGKWRIEILVAMRSGPVRLGQLARLIPAASKKVLTENLRKMEAAGLVVRADFGGTVKHIEYSLNEAIRCETYALLDEIERWAMSFGNITVVPAGKIKL